MSVAFKSIALEDEREVVCKRIGLGKRCIYRSVCISIFEDNGIVCYLGIISCKVSVKSDNVRIILGVGIVNQSAADYVRAVFTFYRIGQVAVNGTFAATGDNVLTGQVFTGLVVRSYTCRRQSSGNGEIVYFFLAFVKILSTCGASIVSDGTFRYVSRFYSGNKFTVGVTESFAAFKRFGSRQFATRAGAIILGRVFAVSCAGKIFCICNLSRKVVTELRNGDVGYRNFRFVVVLLANRAITIFNVTVRRTGRFYSRYPFTVNVRSGYTRFKSIFKLCSYAGRITVIATVVINCGSNACCGSLKINVFYYLSRVVVSKFFDYDTRYFRFVFVKVF